MVRKGNGYTFVELVSVMALIGTLTAAGLPSYQNVIEEAKSIQCLANRRIIEQAAAAYCVGQEKERPSIAELVKAGWLREEPHCISGGKYYWSDEVPGKLLCSIHSQRKQE